MKRSIAAYAIVAVAALVVLAVGFAAFNLADGYLDRRAAAEACTEPASPAEPQPLAQKAKVVIPDVFVNEFEFGRGATAGPRSVLVNLDVALDPDSPLLVQKRTFARDDGVQIAPGSVSAWAKMTGPTTAELTVCVDKAALVTNPGRYRGGLLITDPRLEATTVDMVFSTYPPLPRMLLIGLVLCWLGSVYIYMLRRPSLPDDLKGRAGLLPDNPSIVRPSEFLLGYLKWATRMLGFLTIVSGLITAAVAFNAQYIQSEESWSLSAWLGFIVT